MTGFASIALFIRQPTMFVFGLTFSNRPDVDV